MTPLLCDPGERWEYGISIDWVGKIVEAVSGQRLDRYLAEHICQPLGMHDTAFTLSPSMCARLASVHQRGDDGSLHITYTWKRTKIRYVKISADDLRTVLPK